MAGATTAPVAWGTEYAPAPSRLMGAWAGAVTRPVAVVSTTSIVRAWALTGREAAE